MGTQFHYSDENLAARLKMLMSLANGNDCLNFVIGEKGSGKTTLLKALLEDSRVKWRYCNILFQSRSNSRKVDAVGNLNGRKGILLHIGMPPVLIIDDAHEINIEGLRYLLRHTFKAVGDRKIRGVILFCDPPEKGFVKALSECIPNKSVTNTLHIRPLTSDQTARYLNQFSRHLGLPEKKKFSSSQIKKIYDASRGLPGKVKDEARRILDTGSFRGKTILFKKLFSASFPIYMR